MNCPQCNAWTEVKETRNRGNHVYRRRCCANEHCFTTEERFVVKRGAKTECDAPSKRERND